MRRAFEQLGHLVASLCGLRMTKFLEHFVTLSQGAEFGGNRQDAITHESLKNIVEGDESRVHCTNI